MQKIDRYSVYGRSFGNRFFIASISLLLIVVGIYWLVERLDDELERAELAQFQIRFAELQSAVLLMRASSVASDEQTGLSKFIGANPMNWIEVEVTHYLGERSLGQKVPPGNWIYDPELQVIAYTPKSVSVESLLAAVGVEESIASNQDESAQRWLRFKVDGLLSKDKTSKAATEVSGLELKFVSGTK